MPTSKLLREVADYCWSNKFLDVFHEFFSEHAEQFEDAPETMEEGEHNMVFYELFQDYLVIYEKTLTNYLKSINVSSADFYEDLEDAKDQTTDPYISTFIDCLLASCDYKSFYRVMAKEAKKRRASAITTTTATAAARRPIAESKSESKTSYDDDDKSSGAKKEKKSYK